MIRYRDPEVPLQVLLKRHMPHVGPIKVGSVCDAVMAGVETLAITCHPASRRPRFRDQVLGCATLDCYAMFPIALGRTEHRH